MSKQNYWLLVWMVSAYYVYSDSNNVVQSGCTDVMLTSASHREKTPFFNLSHERMILYI